MLIDLIVKNYRCFPDASPLKIHLRKGFTALVGINNSGKSSILRLFFEFRSLFGTLGNVNSSFISILAGNRTTFNLPSNILDPQEMFSNTNDRNLEMEFQFNPEPGEADQSRYEANVVVLRPRNIFQFELFKEGKSLRGLGFDPESKRVFSGGIADTRAVIPFIFDTFSIFANMLYIPPFRNAINIGTNQNYFDIAVGQSFISNWRVSKTGRTKSLHEAIFRLTEDIRRIFGFRQLEINSSDDNQTMQLYIDGKSYFLPELGSGISHFILVLASVAFKEPSYILVEEPEMGLHPSLQLDFLTTLGSYAAEGVIFSTHSLGLARASAERIFSVQKRENGSSHAEPLERTSRLSEFSGQLSFSGYQELGFDKILLVEGASEVKVFQQFLRKYGLDHKVVLMPLGGNQLINGSRGGRATGIKADFSKPICSH
jgi:predicted ATP-dependent endonuclease of OLD family